MENTKTKNENEQQVIQEVNEVVFDAEQKERRALDALEKVSKLAPKKKIEQLISTLIEKIDDIDYITIQFK